MADKRPERQHGLDPHSISVEADDLFYRARNNPAYWQDIEGWKRSEDPIRSATGYAVAGRLLQFEDPRRAVEQLEEARRLYVSFGYYLNAANAVEIMAALFKSELHDSKQAGLHHALVGDYLTASRNFRPIQPEVMDDDGE